MRASVPVRAWLLAPAWLLALALAAALAGVPPFQARPDASDPVTSILEQVREEAVPPLTTGTRFRVPSSLQRIVAKAMHRDPDQRYASARVFAEDLQAWLEDHPTTLDGPHPSHRARLFARRHRAPLGALLSVLVMFGAVGTTAVVSHQLAQEVREAEARVAAADAQRQEAKGLADAWESEAAVANKNARDAERAKTAALERAAISQSDRDAARKRALMLLQERDVARAEAGTAAEEAATRAAERDEALQRAAIAEADASASKASALTARDERDIARAESSRLQVAFEAASSRAETARATADETERRATEAERRATTQTALRQSAESHAATLQRELEVTRIKLEALERQFIAPTPPPPAGQP